nr:protein YIPF5 [Onthophagus taurus]
MSGNINSQDQNEFWSNQEYYGQFQQATQDSYSFMPDQQTQFVQELSFQTFEASVEPTGGAYPNVYGNNPYLNPQGGYQAPFSPQNAPGEKYQGENYEDEPPLLEELGVNLHHIWQKTLTVLNPLRTPEEEAAKDTDFAGPLVFCLVFGGFLLLSGKVHFGYIYGIGVLGCVSVWALLNLMSTAGVSLGTVVTVLGYCILPMVGLSGINVVFSLQGYIGTVLTSFAIFWCSLSASKLFVVALSMDHQQPLVMYPCGLLYGVFALITVF